MSNAGLLIDLYNLSNPITGYLAIANVIFTIAYGIYGFVMRKSLDKWVSNDNENGEDNWKVPLLILFVLAASALAVYFSPYWFQGGFGWSTFIIPIGCFGAELYFLNDYRKMLANHVWKSGYWRVALISEYFVGILLFCSIAYYVLGRVTTNY